VALDQPRYLDRRAGRNYTSTRRSPSAARSSRLMTRRCTVLGGGCRRFGSRAGVRAPPPREQGAQRQAPYRPAGGASPGSRVRL